jgi:hypothetical protein
MVPEYDRVRTIAEILESVNGSRDAVVNRLLEQALYKAPKPTFSALFDVGARLGSREIRPSGPETARLLLKASSLGSLGLTTWMNELAECRSRLPISTIGWLAYAVRPNWSWSKSWCTTSNRKYGRELRLRTAMHRQVDVDHG